MAESPYIVLARKHRPRQLADVVGQEHVARTLSNAIEQNRVAHALLFTGPRGVGKTSTARILARALNCEHGPTPRPCGECASCVEIQQGASVDVIEIDAASNRGIDEIRELRDAVRYAPSRERFKVYIIDEVHMLTTQAFNALLKTLEEPPPRIQFIFATTEPHKIPDTILSRCQRYDFRRIPVEQIVEHLSQIAVLEQVDAEPGALRLIAQQSEGCMRDAQSLFDQLISFSDGRVETEMAARVLGAVGRDALFRLSGAVLAHDVDRVLAIVDEAYQIGINLVRLASDFLEHLRDLTVAAVAQGEEALLHLTAGERARLAEQAGQSEASVLHRMFSLLLETADEMSRSAYPRLMLEMALIRMTAIEPVEPVGSLLDRIERLTGLNASALPASSAGSEARPAIPTAAAAQPPRQAPSAPGPSRPAPVEAQPKPRAVAPQPSAPPPEPSAAPPATPTKGPSPRVPPATALVGTHASRWRALVEGVNQRSLAVGNLLKEAELDEGDGLAFSVGLSAGLLDIMGAGDKRALVESVGRELFGASARVTLRARQGANGKAGEPAGYRVSEAEAEEHQAELERLSKLVAEHPVTHAVQKVFALDEAQIQITPRLPEEASVLEPEP